MLSILLSLLLTAPAYTKIDPEKAAALDAEQTLPDFEKAAAQLATKDLESPLEFSLSRQPIEEPLREYCDSMKKFPLVFKNCDRVKKSVAASLDKKENAIKKNGKADKFAEAMDQIEVFSQRYNKLRGVQENGENINPDTLKNERASLIKDMQAFCPKVPNAELAASCSASAKNFEIWLADHEESIRKGAFNDPPPSKRTYRDTTPALRCFPTLPKIRGSAAEYRISDPSGRYRYEHLTNSRFGYALNVKLQELTNREVNHPKIIQKQYSDPRNEKTYSFTVSTQFACSPGGPMNCRADAISISLSHAKGSQNLRASAAFPIKPDSSFSLSLPLDEDDLEEFSLSCVIASKIRKGGWVYSDEEFEEK